jgi:hypothetical protein
MSRAELTRIGEVPVHRDLVDANGCRLVPCDAAEVQSRVLAVLEAEPWAALVTGPTWQRASARAVRLEAGEWVVVAVRVTDGATVDRDHARETRRADPFARRGALAVDRVEHEANHGVTALNRGRIEPFSTRAAAGVESPGTRADGVGSPPEPNSAMVTTGQGNQAVHAMRDVQETVRPANCGPTVAHERAAADNAICLVPDFP